MGKKSNAKKVKKSDRIAKINTIYAQLPTVECKGLCHQFCGPILMSHAEESAIQSVGHVVPTLKNIRDDGTCIHLNLLTKRCGIYEHRPLICRLFGMTIKMKCPHGCQPSRWVSDEEGRQLLKSLGSIP